MKHTWFQRISSHLRTGSHAPWPWLIVWLVLNLIQATFTELWHDEANYWMFSRHLDWGFFDHPPAAPLFIWLGSRCLPAELGVRLLMVLSGVITLGLVWKMAEVRDNRLFFSLVFSCLLLHIGGWMAAPDIPLLLFTALFFLLLKKYLDKDSLLTAIGLAIAIAAMGYSKYHGAIPVAAAVMAQPRLLLQRSFWVIPPIIAALLAPHLYWQYVHDFPTFRFHLIDRQPEPYRWQFISDYLLGQWLIFGPLSSILLFWGAFRRRPADAFERCLRWSMIAVLGFFFLQSFRGRTEANWTATAFIPLAILSYRYIFAHPSLYKWVYRLAVPGIALLLVVRLYLMVDFLPHGLNPRNECHGYPEWAADIAREAGDLPVIFYNQYQYAVKFMFYSGRFAHVVNTNAHPGNQFDLHTADEAALQGKDVFSFYMQGDTGKGIRFIAGQKEIRQEMSYDTLRHFQSYNRLRIRFDVALPRSVQRADTMGLYIEIANPTPDTVRWGLPGDRSVGLSALYCVYNRVVFSEVIMPRLPFTFLAPGEKTRLPIQVAVPPQPGQYRFRIGISIENQFTCRNMNFRNIRVE